MKEEEKRNRIYQIAKDIQSGKLFPCCEFCRHYGRNIRKVNNETAELTLYCRLTGEGKGQRELCESFQGRDASLEEDNKSENEYLQRYIQPLEYAGIVNRVLESKIPNQMLLYAAKKIHGKTLKIKINMDNYETHTITFFMDDPKPQKIGDRIWSQTNMPSSEKCGDSYSRLLADSIKNALAEFEEFCKNEE